MQWRLILKGDGRAHPYTCTVYLRSPDEQSVRTLAKDLFPNQLVIAVMPDNYVDFTGFDYD